MIESPNALKSAGRFTIAARFRSFIFAWRGLRWLVYNEHNARVHLGASIVTIGAGLFLKISANDWRWLLLAIGLVWLAEAFNIVIEKMCDHIEPNFDPVIGRIKDVCAGAVLMASIVAAGIGLLTLGPAVWEVLAGIHP